MRRVRVLVNEKDERALVEILGQMIARQNMVVNPVKFRKDRKSIFELSAY